MNTQFDSFVELAGASHPNDLQNALTFLRQLQLQPKPQFDDDLESNGVPPSDTLTFTQSQSLCGDSLLDVCTPPLSPYSQSSNSFAFTNRMNMGGEPNSTPSSSQSEEQIPVCYDFVQGRCARSNCRYLHDFKKLERPNRSSEKRGICFDYLRGDCHRGGLCRFTHDVSSFAKNYTINIEDDISLAKVKRWGQGICFDFVRGACTRGDKCPWSHNLLEIAVATKKGIENMETNERNKIAETVRRRLRGSLENNASCNTESILDFDVKPKSTISSMNDTPLQQKDWVSLWNYPASVFGPLDEFGRPLHWKTGANLDFMN